MLFEGFIFAKNDQFNSENVRNNYQKSLIFEKGYFGIRNSGNLTDQSDKYFGSVIRKNGETDIISNIKLYDSVSPSFDDLTKLNEDISAVVASYSEEQQKITLARDLFGLLPFYYCHVPNAVTAFSTDLSSLIFSPTLKGYVSLNKRRIVAYSTFLMEAGETYTSETFYTNIFAVLPGHILTLSETGANSQPYVTFHPDQWSGGLSIGEYAEELRGKFLDSVRHKLTYPSRNLAAHLSGGMDSSSVSAAIKFLQPEQNLHTLYNKTNTVDSDENLFARSVAESIGSEHHEIIQSQEDFHLLSIYIPLFAQPTAALISPSSNVSLMLQAKKLGCDTVFNGRDGDSIVGSGFELIDRLFHQQQWNEVKELLRKRVAHYSLTNQFPDWNRYSYEKKYNAVLQNYLFKKLTSKLLQSSITEFYRFYKEISSHFPISHSFFLQKGTTSLLNKIKKGQVNSISTVLRDDLASSFRNDSIPELLNLIASDSVDGRRSLRDVFNRHAILANEQNFVLGRHQGMINKSPFYDRDLFELCMSVPDILKYGEGIGRAHFREAMKGLLPENVRLRSSKTHVRVHGQEVIQRLYQEAGPMIYDSSEVWDFVDREKLKQQVGILKNDKISYLHKINTWFHISRTVSLTIWLDWYKKSGGSN
jgi:asparagine synthase (glutamine-hydrolysing)